MSLFLADPESPERIRPPSPPAVFGLPVRTLGIAAHWCSPATGTLLAAEIGRHPANLHLHMQRMALWQRLGDDIRLAAAVVDMWIVLGRCGESLRLRLLRNHYNALDQLDLGIYLSERLGVGIDRHDARIAVPGVVLARPIEGCRAFVHALDAPS